MNQKDAVPSPERSIIRVTVVIALAVFALGITWLNLLTASYGGGPGGGDVIIGSDFVVQSVLPRSASATAGLRVGDKIDLQGLDLLGRLTVLGDRVVNPGEAVKFTIVRKGARIPVVVHPPGSRGSVYLIVIKRSAATIFVIIAGILVLRRPTRMLWGFYLLALSSVWGSPLIFSWSPAWLQVALYEVFMQIYYTAFLVAGLWMFVSRFPSDRAEGWRGWVDRSAIPVGIVLACASLVSSVLSFAGISQPAIVSRLLSSASAGASPRVAIAVAVALGMLFLFSGFATLRTDERQRLKWVFTAFAVSLIAIAYTNVAAYFPNGGWPVAWSNAGFTSGALVGIQIVIPLAVAYAVLRHRVLDINFIISRALVYAVLTSLLVTIFALLDWFFVRKLVATNLGLIVEILLAIGLGFWLNSLHHRVDAFIDRVFFKQRYRAQLLLGQIATALPHANSSAVVYDLIVSGPFDALDLASAAVFIRAADDSYKREKSIGWADGCATSFAPDDAMVLHLRSHLRPFKVSEVHWPCADLPGDAAYPALALPLVVRNQVVAIAFYGAHKNGSDLDPDEVRIISQLGSAASAAFDHLEAQALRKEVESLRSLLAESQIQPA